MALAVDTLAAGSLRCHRRRWEAGPEAAIQTCADRQAARAARAAQRPRRTRSSASAATSCRLDANQRAP
eukprot:scaffold28233_cov112-Isochrysis_galbana.AAC.1